MRSLAKARSVGPALVYSWADGVYFSPRQEHDKQWLLVILDADTLGDKHIVGVMDCS